ncbi:MAG: serine/threonine protein kinase [Myxococcales bacterium]|nr:MAG: serine/threonine protein kinase [Myxococcales bacterium]
MAIERSKRSPHELTPSLPSVPRLPPPMLEVLGASKSSSQQSAIGSGNYRLGRQLGVGGMATVYEAVKLGAEGFRKRVAIKRIHPHLGDVGFVELLADEARLASSIQHPNVCQVLDFVSDEGGTFIAMELLDGRTLRQVLMALQADPTLAASPRHQLFIARVLVGLAEGLHAAHELTDEQGTILEVVHRDVSPHNLFVLKSGGVKVTDFGIARARNQLHHTATGTMKGKLAYAAPEQISGQRVDRRADVYGLGIVLWELLTGERLFHRSSEAATIAAVCAGTVPDPRVHQPVVLPGLAEIAKKALQLEPSRRFESARALSRALDRVLVSTGDSISHGEVAEWLAGVPVDIEPGASRHEAALAVVVEITSTPGVSPSLEPLPLVTRRLGPAAPRHRWNRRSAWLGAAFIAAGSVGVAWRAMPQTPPMAGSPTARPAPVATGTLLVRASGGSVKVLAEGRTYSDNQLISLPVGLRHITVLPMAPGGKAKDVVVKVERDVTSVIPVTIVEENP